MIGTGGADQIVAYGGSDTVDANAGPDYVAADGGSDTVRGASGLDAYVDASGNFQGSMVAPPAITSTAVVAVMCSAVAMVPTRSRAKAATI
jgi:hypothetical protein